MMYLMIWKGALDNWIPMKSSSHRYMASSIAPVDCEPWHTIGVRKIIAKNFYIYYRPDNSSGKVYVLNVIYAKRDQLKALKNMFQNE